MRFALSCFAFTAVIIAGCGPQAGPTVFATVPAPQPAPAEPTKPTERVKISRPIERPKSSDPWKEAREYFEEVAKTEKEVTNKKINKLDFMTQYTIRIYLNRDINSGTESGLTAGELLISEGLTEHVTVAAKEAIDNKTFRDLMAKYNPNPTRDEIIEGVIQYGITEDIKISIYATKALNGDRRESKELNQLVARWTRK